MTGIGRGAGGADREDSAGRSAPWSATLAAAAGVTFVGAGLALWASEGALVFAENAFSAVIACF